MSKTLVISLKGYYSTLLRKDGTMSFDDLERHDVDIKRCDSCDTPYERGELYHIMGLDICHTCREESQVDTIEEYYGHYREK